jgi:hypothetical protein
MDDGALILPILIGLAIQYFIIKYAVQAGIDASVTRLKIEDIRTVVIDGYKRDHSEGE